MASDFDKVVERVLVLKDEKTGQQQQVIIEIGRPYWTEPDMEAACPVAIEGLLPRREDIRGIDPFNALELAIGFINSFLSKLPKTQKLEWLSGDDYFE